MSPEFNFRIKMDLPSRQIAEAVASGISKKIGMKVVIFDESQVSTGIINSPEQRKIALSEKEEEILSGLSFGRAYRYLRQKEGLSQKRASRLAEMNPETMNRIENERVLHPRLSTVFKLLKSVNIDSNDVRFPLLLAKLPSPETDLILNFYKE